MLKRQTINAWGLRCECIKITPDTYAPDVPTQIRLNPSIFTCAIHKYVGVYLAKEGITIPISKDRADNVKKASVYRVMLTEALLKQIDNRCPYCDEIIRTSATRCPHCTGDLPEPEQLFELNNTERPADTIKKPSIHSILPTDNLIYDSKECPHCGKRIGSNAERCPHCRTDL